MHGPRKPHPVGAQYIVPAVFARKSSRLNRGSIGSSVGRADARGGLDYLVFAVLGSRVFCANVGRKSLIAPFLVLLLHFI
jgi:hypothetical protein